MLTVAKQLIERDADGKKVGGHIPAGEVRIGRLIGRSTGDGAYRVAHARRDVDSGLSIAVRYQRDVTSRSLTAGDDQERELAEGYKAQSRHFREWPRISAIFTSLAHSYEREAAVHDREAEAHRRGLPR